MATIDLTGYHLTFDDEFNTRSISQTGAGTTWSDIRSQWRYDANSDIGFGHSSFVDPASGYDPFNVSGGALKITAVPDQTKYGAKGSWESGLITTQNGFAQTYGYFEVRANFSAQTGAWDAFWLLPKTQIADPYNAGHWQELDVVEHYGGDPRSVYSTIHTTDPQNGVPWQENRQVYSQMSSPAGYHTYGMNWQADYISFYVDGQLVGKQATPSDMHGPMYLLVNLATQGADHAANNADAANVPISSSIDYVRVYSNDPNTAAVVQQQVSSPDGRDPGLYGASVKAATALTAANPSDHVNVDAKVFALYDGLLSRAPDAVGASAWASALSHGQSLHDVTQSILGSAEGQLHFNSTLSNAAYVEQLYETVLGRHAGATEGDGFVSALAAGGSRADIADAFIFSAEHLSQLQQGSGAASYLPGTTDALMVRLYYGILERAPDAGGLQSWQAAAHAGTSAASIAQGFLNSSEYAAAHAGQGDAQFISSLYSDGLGRLPEADGQQGWLSALAHGASRADVAIGILNSPEAQHHLSAQVVQGLLIA